MALELAGYTLGIDLGPNSVGWAAVRENSILGMGARVFEQGVVGDLEQGKEQSKNVDRRQARQVRRQLERRARRQTKVYNLLRRAGLAPEPAPDRHAALEKLDLALSERLDGDRDSRCGLSAEVRRAAGQTLPYRLRARALDHRLERDELGRALYHLAQRRGFLSNRKAAPKADEEEGQVKEHIQKLRGWIEEAGARTLGEYFAGLDSTQQRIRAQWTARDLYEKEFDAICAAQAAHYPDVLTPEFVAALRSAMFYQRPLKDVKPGKCDLEKGEYRARVAHPLNQRRRLLEAVRNLELAPPPGGGLPIALSDEQEAMLIEALEHGGDQTMAEARKLIGVRGKEWNGWKLNLELGGEKRLVGNRTAAKIRGAIGARWDAMDEAGQELLIEDLREFEHEADLEKHLRDVRGWAADDAKELSKVRLEDGYALLSVAAIRKLLPHLEAGMRYGEARKLEYPEATRAGRVYDRLPPVLSDDFEDGLRNPAVERSLTELRKVVNAIVRKFGKPERIHVEVARDLKNPKKDRERLWKRNRENERDRETAYKAIQAEHAHMRPRRPDIEKYLLWIECGGICPYTGQTITLNALYSGDSRFEVEHIIPRSRSLDNSFANKTLSDIEANRFKRDRTPHEAFGGGTEWDAILQRVRRFKGNAALAKLRRFEMTEVSADQFTARQLNDTRYASKLASRYLGLLYGGPYDAGGVKRIQASAGGVTGKLRADWGLNAILNDGETSGGGAVAKTRADHRHHAVDALVIALTTESTIQKLARATAEADRTNGREYKFEDPWTGFCQEAREAVQSVVVSHRPNRRVRAKLHDDSLYSKAYTKVVKGKQVEVRRIRKPLAGMTPNDIEAIVDPAVKKAVEEKLASLGGDSKKFADPRNLPMLPNKSGPPVPIRSARIERVQSVATVGKGPRERHVALASNHHLEVYAVLGPDGKEKKWDGKLVSMYEAMRRVREKRPVVEREHGPGTKFKFSLSPGDTIELREEDGTRRLYHVRSVSQEAEKGGRRPPPNIEIADVGDARKKIDIKAAGRWLKRAVNALSANGARKVQVSPSGDCSYLRD